MTTAPKTSRSSDALRSAIGIGLPDGGGQTLANAREVWCNASTECQRETIGFVSMWLEKDTQVAREMMVCKNLADVAPIQSRWMEETLRDYNSEMSKLMTICARSVNGEAGSRD